jgi:hypothetical protein
MNDSTPTSIIHPRLTLEDLGIAISVKLGKAEGMMVSAIQMLREARERVVEEGAMPWSDWCSANVKKKDGTAYSLEYIQKKIGSTEPQTEEEIADRVDRERDRQRIKSVEVRTSAKANPLQAAAAEVAELLEPETNADHEAGRWMQTAKGCAEYGRMWTLKTAPATPEFLAACDEIIARWTKVRKRVAAEMAQPAEEVAIAQQEVRLKTGLAAKAAKDRLTAAHSKAQDELWEDKPLSSGVIDEIMDARGEADLAEREEKRIAAKSKKAMAAEVKRQAEVAEEELRQANGARLRKQMAEEAAAQTP